MDEQGIIDLVSAMEENICDEEKDADENTDQSTQNTMLGFTYKG